MSSSNTVENVTSPGESDSPQGTAVGGRRSPQKSRSPSGAKSVGMLKQVPTASNGAGNITAVGGGKQAPDGGRKATEATATALSRTQAEAKYGKLLEDTQRHLEALETLVQASSNTKTDIKSGTRALGICFRDFLKIAKSIGMIRTSDSTEQRIRYLQQQQQQQHCQTMKLINELREEQLQHHKQTQLQLESLSQIQQECKIAAEIPANEEPARRGENIQTTTIVDVDKAPGTSWSLVAGRKTRRQNSRPLAAVSSNNRKEMRPATRVKPPAILVDISKEDFPTVAKKIRQEANKEVIGNSVVGMRQTKNGGLLIQVRGDATRVEAVRAEVARSAGTDVGVKALQQKAMVEIRDLDEWTEREEIRDAISSAVGNERDDIRVVSLRKHYGGVQVARALVSSHEANTLVGAGHIKIGMVSCRIRLCDGRIRCYRCLAYGHNSKTCNGQDRSKCCKSCGKVDHFANNCKALQQEKLIFAKTIESTEGSLREDRGRGRCPRCLVFGHLKGECIGPDRKDCCRECGEKGHQAAQCRSAEDTRLAFRALLSFEESKATKDLRNDPSTPN